MHDADIRQLIDRGESISVAFARRASAAYVNERRVIEIMACLANAQGGTLLIGVDRDGTISGCHPFHGDITDPALLASAVYRHTTPGLAVEVEQVVVDGRPVVALTTGAQPTPVATTWGVYRTRRLNAQGTAECVGIDPASVVTRYRDANGMDWALAPAIGATLADVSARAVDAYRGLLTDTRLAQLDDEALVRALGFIDDSDHPVALGAILLFGTPDAVRRFLPYHVLTVADQRKVDGRPSPTTFRSSAPLSLMLADLKRNADTFGPAFPLVVNALLHRDYFLPGPVYVALNTQGAKVTSPGSAPRGIDLAAAAAGSASYAPRSLYLSTALSRTSITEGAGCGLPGMSEMGVSFEGSHDQGVTASMNWTVAEASGLGGNEAKVLLAVRELGSDGASSSEIAQAAGLSSQQAYRALRKLVDRGLINRTGETRTTRYLP